MKNRSEGANMGSLISPVFFLFFPVLGKMGLFDAVPTKT